MSDPINANPTVIDINNLPTRLNTLDDDASALEGKNAKLISEITSLSLLSYPNIDNGDLTSLEESLTSSSLSSNAASDDDVDVDVDDDDDIVDTEFTSDSRTVATANNDEDPIDEQEIFDLIATISDPEHPLTLAQLAVVNLDDISIQHAPRNQISTVTIKITPTITHCSLATLIGLGIRVRLERSLPARFRIKIVIKEGTHQSESQVNKQLNDKERVAAACENDQLLGVISQMLSTCK
ncbi:hypothetical protein KGF57_000911 [Candida theae]|uniref:MIP18 family-like domain-containing protein n=1 Tax=Candida theae TaxID=1198502 RepID=A0AAD5BI79_9ASCO|nr:uncharacterized protein KGF57_000911 [Candida theae]KAI5965118.1 hypothetical protein KGF57_000911 [Candida theae]